MLKYVTRFHQIHTDQLVRKIGQHRDQNTKKCQLLSFINKFSSTSVQSVRSLQIK